MGLVGVGGQLGLTAGVVAVGAGRGLGWAGGGWEALPIAAVALAAAKATAKGIVGLAGEGSHLDLLIGLPDSPPSWVGCLVLLQALVCTAGLWLGMGVVLCLLPTLTQVLGEGSSSAVATVAAAVAVTVAAAASSGASLLVAGDGDGSAAATVAASACLPAAAATASPPGTAASCLATPAATTEAPERYMVSV